jgi:hypothetical protein
VLLVGEISLVEHAEHILRRAASPPVSFLGSTLFKFFAVPSNQEIK